MRATNIQRTKNFVSFILFQFFSPTNGLGEFCGTVAVPGSVSFCHGEGEFCKGQQGDCLRNGLGVCTQKPIGRCPDEHNNPVCGCDGNTYASECAAMWHGVNIAKFGECDHLEENGVCGGPFRLGCPSNMFCKLEMGQCEIASLGFGSCQLAPIACQREMKPVCGCDGHVYDNSCLAFQTGTSIANHGECPRRRYLKGPVV